MPAGAVATAWPFGAAAGAGEDVGGVPGAEEWAAVVAGALGVAAAVAAAVDFPCFFFDP